MSEYSISTRDGMITADCIARVRDRADIVQIVAELHEIKKAGISWKGCCPFHDEKSPSFNVHPIKGIYKCFGCGASGDVFGFVMAKRQLSFRQAVEYVAGRIHEPIEYERVNVTRSQFYKRVLWQHPASTTTTTTAIGADPAGAERPDDRAV